MPSIVTQRAPRTHVTELDLTQRLATANTLAGALTLVSKRGPTKPTLVTSQDELFSLYGRPNAQVGFGHYTADAFLRDSNQLWVNRVTNGDLHSGLYYLKDPINEGRLFAQPFPAGSDTDFEGGVHDTWVVSFKPTAPATDASFLADDEIDIVVTDGVTSEAVNVVFSTNHETTINNLVVALQAAIDNYASGGVVSAIPYADTTANPTDKIFIRVPKTISLSLVSSSTTPATAPTIAVDTNAMVMAVFAENPGVWGNDYGTKITAVDVGIRQRFALSFNIALQATQSFTCKVNGTQLANVPFNTDSDTTLADIATALEATDQIESAKVVSVSGALDNDRVIEVVAAKAKPEYLSITDAAVSPVVGGTAVTVTVVETLAGVAPEYTFRLEVFNRDNVRRPVERFGTSLRKQVNGYGTQEAADVVVNKGSAASINIRTFINESNRDFAFNPVEQDGVQVNDLTINWMGGGKDGATPTTSHIINGWDAFKDRIRYPAAIFLNGGYSIPAVQQKMVELCESRMDSTAILDTPSSKQKATDAYNYRVYELNIDSSYGALYSPDLLIPDASSDEELFIPPSGHVGAVYSYSTRVSAEWFAPAGLNRGRPRSVSGLREYYDEGEQDLIYPVGVNPIIDKPGAGPVIWGEETLQWKKSILSSVHARRLLNLIEVTYTDGLDYTMFQPNDQFTWREVEALGRSLLEPIKNGRGLHEYKVICGPDNNREPSLSQGILHVDIVLQIIEAVKEIRLRAILSRSGPAFEVAIADINV